MPRYPSHLRDISCGTCGRGRRRQRPRVLPQMHEPRLRREGEQGLAMTAAPTVVAAAQNDGLPLLPARKRGVYDATITNHALERLAQSQSPYPSSAMRIRAARSSAC